MCKPSPPTNFLASRGYQVVRQPRDGIELLSLFEFEKGKLYPLNSSLKVLLTPEQIGRLPESTDDELVSEINGKATERVSADVGLGVLKNMIPGYRAAIEAHYGGARDVVFRFQNVTRDSIDILGTELALADFSLEDQAFALRERALNRRLFAVTGLLKSNAISVKAFDRHNQEIKAELEAEDFVNARGSVSRNAEHDDEIVFQSEDDLAIVFAIDARRLVFVNGKFRQLKRSHEEPVALGADDQEYPVNEHAQLINPNLLVDLSDETRPL